MKKVIFFLFIMFAFQTINAQSFSENFFQSGGWNLFIFSSVSSLSPAMIELSEDLPEYLTTNASIEQHYDGGGMGYIYSIRYNLFEFDKERSISLEIPITFGILSFSSNKNLDAFQSDGYGSINIPLLLQFNYGNGATYKSSHNTGFVLGVGLEFNLHPIITTFPTTTERPALGDILRYKTFYYEYDRFNKKWIAPVIQLGYRYWNKNNKLKEIGIKYSFGEKTSWIDTGDGGTRNHSPNNLQITFLTFMNY